jgi:hypothetical protein
LVTVCCADPAPLQLSTAMTWKFKVPRFMPWLAQALKWLAMVTVPLVRPPLRTEMYWLKVLVPTMDGSLVRVSSQMV